MKTEDRMKEEIKAVLEYNLNDYYVGSMAVAGVMSTLGGSYGGDKSVEDSQSSTGESGTQGA